MSVEENTSAYKGPLVVLVDHQTQSAAEVLAGSLQSSGRALVIGSTTFGKGLVQTLLPVSTDWVFVKTTHELKLGDQHLRYHGAGVQPNIEVATDELPLIEKDLYPYSQAAFQKHPLLSEPEGLKEWKKACPVRPEDSALEVAQGRLGCKLAF